MQRMVRTELSTDKQIWDGRREARARKPRYRRFTTLEFVHTRTSDGRTGPTLGPWLFHHKVDLVKNAEDELSNAVSLCDLRLLRKVLAGGYITRKAASAARRKALEEAKDAAHEASRHITMMDVLRGHNQEKSLATQKKCEAIAKVLEEYLASPRQQLAMSSV